MKSLKFFLIIVPFLFSSCDHSTKVQEDFPEKISFMVSDHILTEYNITSIAFDKDGVAWIGTFKQGLIKYDGTVEVFNSENSILSPDLVIRDVSVDHNNIIWCATSPGLLKYDGKNFEVFTKENSPLLEDAVWDLEVDTENNLWISSCIYNAGGLMKLSNGIWTSYTPDNSRLPQHGIRCLSIDDQNNLWGGVDFSSIVRISNNTMDVFDENKIGFHPWAFTDIVVRDETVFASVDYSLSSAALPIGPTLVKYENQKWSDITPDIKDGKFGMAGKFIIDKRGYIWSYYFLDWERYIIVYKDNKWSHKLVDIPVNVYSPLAVDKSNTIWIGTHEGIYLIEQ